jgi:hypothetical protein
VATLVDADYLFLMTDVDALYTANPKVRAPPHPTRTRHGHLPPTAARNSLHSLLLRLCFCAGTLDL